MKAGTRRRVVNVGTGRRVVDVGTGRQVVYCRPVGPFPVFEAVWNLQGWRQDLACSPNFEWYLHKPGISGHVWFPILGTFVSRDPGRYKCLI